MYQDSTVGGVILAAGNSSRMGQGLNKVYKDLRGKPVLRYSIDTFLESGLVDEIVIVFNDNEVQILEEKVLGPLSHDLADRDIALKCVPGGSRRQDSSRKGVEASDVDYVCIHDGARPNFSSELVVELLRSAVEYGAAFPGIKPVDTIRENDNGFAGETVDRDRLVKVQTPQCIERTLLLDSIEEAGNRGLYFTDDAGIVMEVANAKPRVIEGERGNVKMTNPLDARMIEVLMDS